MIVKCKRNPVPIRTSMGFDDFEHPLYGYEPSPTPSLSMHRTPKHRDCDPSLTFLGEGDTHPTTSCLYPDPLHLCPGKNTSLPREEI